LTPKKIFNDPVHGFIEVPKGILLDLIDSEIFQRLRRIRQLALTSLIYPGAVHSRFNHALGAMYLMQQALETLSSKGVDISPEEKEAAQIAILLHDLGHGPFSHALENVIIPGLHHETMSRKLMEKLNVQFEGKLSLAIQIFEDEYPKKFLHQLVSGQLDMDRMDYLMRDSFFTGVAEGIVGTDRIIKTLHVRDNALVVEHKGIYSVEKFIIARRLMYWQVYLHKAVISAEYMLIHILKRARFLQQAGEKIWLNETLHWFFTHHFPESTSISQEAVEHFIKLDDEDILYALKQWQFSSDETLSNLCKGLLHRKLLKAKLQDTPFSEEEIALVQKQSGISNPEYFIFTGTVSNLAYLGNRKEPILIQYKEGHVVDLAQASDMHNIEALSLPVKKYFFCWSEALSRKK
jgi:HD superfamily phosphohydrolase